MRVIVNTMCTLNVRSGVGHHTSELVQALQARAEPGTVGTYPTGAFLPVNRFWVRAVERYHRCLERPGRVARAEALARRAALGVLRRGGKLLVRDPFNYCVRRGGYDLYHEPNFHALPCDLPTVVTVHDLSVLLHPQWHPPRRLAEYARLFADTLKRACHVLAVSEFTKGEVVEHLGWPADKVTVTYNGRRPFLRPLLAEACAPVLHKLKLEPGYLLHVGTVEPRKNLGLLLTAHAGLPLEVRRRHPLVLVGGAGWNAADLEADLADRAKDGTVRRLGYVPDAALAALYSSARALVFPTLYEGFGMPTVEMMACGGAVLASTAGAVAETVGGTAHLTDPRDELGWRDAMLRVCTDDHWWQSLRAGAEETARPFTWGACADATLGAYRRALGEETSGKRAA